MTDEKTERELRTAAELLDPVPEHLISTAVTAFTWRTVEAELATLVLDSLAAPANAVRGPDHPRQLTFRAGDVTIELELVIDGATRRLVGWLNPAGPVEMEIQHSRGTLTVAVDPLGRFAAGGLARGPIRLRCHPAGGTTAMVTDWFSA